MTEKSQTYLPLIGSFFSHLVRAFRSFRSRTGHPAFFQPALDEIRAVARQRPLENLPDNGSCFLVHQKVVLVVRVLPVTKGRDAAGKLAFLGLQ